MKKLCTFLLLAAYFVGIDATANPYLPSIIDQDRIFDVRATYEAESWWLKQANIHCDYFDRYIKLTLANYRNQYVGAISEDILDGRRKYIVDIFNQDTSYIGFLLFGGGIIEEVDEQARAFVFSGNSIEIQFSQYGDIAAENKFSKKNHDICVGEKGFLFVSLMRERNKILNKKVKIDYSKQ